MGSARTEAKKAERERLRGSKLPARARTERDYTAIRDHAGGPHGMKQWAARLADEWLAEQHPPVPKGVWR